MECLTTRQRECCLQLGVVKKLTYLLDLWFDPIDFSNDINH